MIECPQICLNDSYVVIAFEKLLKGIVADVKRSNVIIFGKIKRNGTTHHAGAKYSYLHNLFFYVMSSCTEVNSVASHTSAATKYQQNTEVPFIIMEI